MGLVLVNSRHGSRALHCPTYEVSGESGREWMASEHGIYVCWRHIVSINFGKHKLGVIKAGEFE